MLKLFALVSGDVDEVELGHGGRRMGDAPVLVLRCDGKPSWRLARPWHRVFTPAPQSLLSFVHACVAGRGQSVISFSNELSLPRSNDGNGLPGAAFAAWPEYFAGTQIHQIYPVPLTEPAIFPWQGIRAISPFNGKTEAQSGKPVNDLFDMRPHRRIILVRCATRRPNIQTSVDNSLRPLAVCVRG